MDSLEKIKCDNRIRDGILTVIDGMNHSKSDKYIAERTPAILGEVLDACYERMAKACAYRAAWKKYFPAKNHHFCLACQKEVATKGYYCDACNEKIESQAPEYKSAFWQKAKHSFGQQETKKIQNNEI